MEEQKNRLTTPFDAVATGAVIRAARKRAGLTLRGLGTLLRISASTIHNMEQGYDVAAINYTAVQLWIDTLPPVCPHCAGTGNAPTTQEA